MANERTPEHYSLDYAEDQARRRRPMHMADWVEKLDAFLAFNERDILTHTGAAGPEKEEKAVMEERKAKLEEIGYGG